jgi:hypothetical protein
MHAVLVTLRPQCLQLCRFIYITVTVRVVGRAAVRLRAFVGISCMQLRQHSAIRISDSAPPVQEIYIYMKC